MNILQKLNNFLSQWNFPQIQLILGHKYVGKLKNNLVFFLTTMGKCGYQEQWEW